MPGTLQLVSPLPAGAVNNSNATGGAKGTGVIDISNLNVPAGTELLIQFEVRVAAGVAAGTIATNQSQLLVERRARDAQRRSQRQWPGGSDGRWRRRSHARADRHADAHVRKDCAERRNCASRRRRALSTAAHERQRRAVQRLLDPRRARSLEQPGDVRAGHAHVGERVARRAPRTTATPTGGSKGTGPARSAQSHASASRARPTTP